MRVTTPLAIVCGSLLLFLAPLAEAASRVVPTTSKKKPVAARFVFKDQSGRVVSAPIVERYHGRKIARPVARVDRRIDPRLMRAATIAQERAHARSKSRCWRYVKEALIAAGVVNSRPKTAYAKQAADELVRDFGFKRLPIRDPYAAPVGSVLVYGSRRAAGHIEFRTPTGFVSDFRSPKPSRRPLIAVLTKA